jgi:hypothetical protein
MLVVQIEELTLDRKVSQSVASWAGNQTYPKKLNALTINL